MGQRAIRGNHCHIWIGENVLSRAKLDAGKIERLFLKRPNVFFIKAIEPNVIVKKEPRIVGKNLLDASALELN